VSSQSRNVDRERGRVVVGASTTAELLTHALGVLVATRPDGKAREVVGVAQEAMDLISTRRRKLTAKAEELVRAFETRYGRGPSGLGRERLMQAGHADDPRREVAHR
jgi:hypothetical protein